jgi:hypothetical protein
MLNEEDWCFRRPCLRQQITDGRQHLIAPVRGWIAVDHRILDIDY